MHAYYKICHTTCHTGWGGLERRIYNEIKWMRNHGHNVFLVCPEGTPLFTQAKEAGFKVYAISFKRLSTLKDHQAIKDILYNEKPDIINVHGNKDAKLALHAARQMEVPCRILSRHISAHVRNSWYNRLIYKKWAHYIFTTADYTTEHLKKVFKLKEMQVFSIPSGIIPPGEMPERNDAQTRLSEELELGTDARFIGFIGRVSKDKGVEMLIDAFERVAPSLPNHHLVLVGSGEPSELDLFRKKANRCRAAGRIHFIGFKEDVWPLHRALDCHLLPSVNRNGIPFEGVPQALLEAMFAETPVVASQSGGIQDIVSDGETGLLHLPGDTDHLARQIRHCIEDRQGTKKRVRAAREQVEKHHTIDAMGRDIVRIYRLHQVRLERVPYPSF